MNNYEEYPNERQNLAIDLLTEIPLDLLLSASYAALASMLKQGEGKWNEAEKAAFEKAMSVLRSVALGVYAALGDDRYAERDKPLNIGQYL